MAIGSDGGASNEMKNEGGRGIADAEVQGALAPAGRLVAHVTMWHTERAWMGLLPALSSCSSVRAHASRRRGRQRHRHSAFRILSGMASLGMAMGTGVAELALAGRRIIGVERRKVRLFSPVGHLHFIVLIYGSCSVLCSEV